MHLKEIKKQIPEALYTILDKEIKDLVPSQEKAIEKGLFKGKNLVICTPTASGKTLIAEMACVKKILEQYGKAVYIVPLKALAAEKYKDFREKYGHLFKIALSIGDPDSSDLYLKAYDLIICTSEKLDSLMRHNTPWLKDVATVVIDEIHLLNDINRGPTLEILLTTLRRLLKNVQIIGLSATIGNPLDLATWLDAELVLDNWRPIPLHKGVYFEGKIEFEEKKK